MARCQCAGSSCSCLIEGGPGVNVTGVGTANQPYVISSTPNYYSHSFSPSEGYYYINSTGLSEIGNRAVYNFEVPSASAAYIWIPDGDINSPLPALGAEFDVILTGSSDSTVNWSGAVKTWYGHTSSPGNAMGWYHFVFLGDRFAVNYIGPSYAI